MKAGNPCLLLSLLHVLCSSHVKAPPQNQRPSSCFQGLPRSGWPFSLLPPKPGCTQLGRCLRAAGPREGWQWHHTLWGADWDPCPTPLHPSLPLLLSAKERYSGASWLALSVWSKRAEISNKSRAVFRLAWDFPQGINHPYLGRRMPAFRSRPLAGGKGSLTLFPWFSLSTHDPVALLLWCRPLSSGSGEAPSVPGASAGSVGCCFLVSNGCSVQRNCKYLCKAPVLVIFSCSLIWDLPVVAFTQEHQSTF